MSKGPGAGAAATSSWSSISLPSAPSSSSATATPLRPPIPFHCSARRVACAHSAGAGDDISGPCMTFEASDRRSDIDR
ncbi:hypothetical protein C8R44DRAFT_869197 [Mycena epipterygia]|nr:hypothetical protein C8R44DRAFT_869197 [Mycena epipterygia]